MSEIKREFVFKVVLMGDGSVGKTSIRSKFMGLGFKSEYIKTIGADFASKAIILGQNKVHFQTWDLAGQKMYRHVRSSFYNGCKCGFLVFDLTQPETLDSLDTWVEEAIEHSGGFIKVFMIIGNKNDLKDQIKVKREDVQELLDKLNKMKDITADYIETSALTGENIHEAFETMGRMFLEREGFPRKGQGIEIDDETLEKHHQEIQPLISMSGAPSQKTSGKNSSEETPIDGLSEDEVQIIVKTILDKINQLTQITVGLEERLQLIETKKGTSETDADIHELKSKITLLEQQLDRFSIAVDNSKNNEKVKTDFPTAETRPTIPVPTIGDIDQSDHKTDDSVYEELDRTMLKTMSVLDENDDEDNIAEILTETEQDSTDEQKVIEKTQIESPEEKEEDLKKQSKKQTRCPKCGSKLSFIKQYNRWYCYRCKIYV